MKVVYIPYYILCFKNNFMLFHFLKRMDLCLFGLVWSGMFIYPVGLPHARLFMSWQVLNSIESKSNPSLRF